MVGNHEDMKESLIHLKAYIDSIPPSSSLDDDDDDDDNDDDDDDDDESHRQSQVDLAL